MLAGSAKYGTGSAAAYSWRGLSRIILFTFEESLASVFVSVLVGLPLAFFVARRKFPGRRFLLSLSGIPFCVPTLIMALGYISTFGMAGTVNRALMGLLGLKEPPLTFLYSFWGIVLTQGFYNFPLVMVTVADSWASLDTSEEDSARLLGAGEFKVFRTVTLFKLLPAVTSAAIPVFLYCFFSFIIIMMFGAVGATTLEVAVYHAGRSVLDFRSAALLALIETGCAFVVLMLYSLFEKKGLRSTGLSFDGIKEAQQPVRKGERPLALCAGLMTAAFFLLPVASIVVSTFLSRNSGRTFFTFKAWAHLFKMKGFYNSLRNTVWVGFFSSVLATAAAAVPAVLMRMSRGDKAPLLGFL